MIVVDLVVAFAFFVFISLFYKRGMSILSNFLSKYSYNIEKSFTQKSQSYSKKQEELDDLLSNDELAKTIEKITNERKNKVSEILATYNNIEKKYHHHIDEKIESIKNTMMCDYSLHYDMQKKYINSNVKIDTNQLLVKFANLYKKRHNID